MTATWIKFILNKLVPSFGGILTFCEDPDDLLEIFEVREALRQSRMMISDWDGSLESLILLNQVDENSKPLLIVLDSSLRYLVEAQCQDYHWEVISIGEIFSKFPHELVKSIPTVHWDRLFILHEQTRRCLNFNESAEQIARAIYGCDPLYLTIGTGWIELIIKIALSEQGLPIVIAETLYTHLKSIFKKPFSIEILTDPSQALAAIISLLKENPTQLEEITPAIKQLLDKIQQIDNRSINNYLNNRNEFVELVTPNLTSIDCLNYGLRYSEAITFGKISNETRLETNRKFFDWLETNYSVVLSSPNHDILKVTNIIKTIDNSVGEERLLLIIIDGLSLPAWFIIQNTWQRNKIIGSDTQTKSAFAILPTLTPFSRRAIFEGKSPLKFSATPFSAKLERRLWQQQFSNQGVYFSSQEQTGILDAFALGKLRICIVDTLWDEYCHKINPQFETLEEAAKNWAERTQLANLIIKGLNHGYKLFIISDHGQILCEGSGKIKTGDLTEERSKRVMLFNNQALSKQYETEYTIAFQPTGLPNNCWPVFTRDFWAFEQAGQLRYSHGGLSLEEVMVPVVEVK